MKKTSKTKAVRLTEGAEVIVTHDEENAFLGDVLGRCRQGVLVRLKNPPGRVSLMMGVNGLVVCAKPERLELAE
jgi:hypothetical protein